VNRPGVLLDTGPLVALLSSDDDQHGRAKRLFADCAPPLRTCEAVVAEACFLMRKVSATGPAEVAALGQRGLFRIGWAAEQHWTNLETILRKYRDRPISFADACLIRCAEVWEESRILTFDDDFTVYRWARNRKFNPL
jgi:uncharacterized protein